VRPQARLAEAYAAAVDGERVVVRGRAVRHVRPDRASWALAVTERGEEPGEVFAACAARLGRLVAALHEETRPGEEVTTGAVALQPEWSEGRRPRTRAQAQVRVTCALERAGWYATTAVDAGADERVGPTPLVSGAAGRSPPRTVPVCGWRPRTSPSRLR